MLSDCYDSITDIPYQGYTSIMNKSKLIPLFAFLLLAACQPSSHETYTPNVYERVMSLSKIRCGYFDWDPLLKKDVNTGEFSGIGADIMNEIDSRLGITHEWVEETGPATAVESIKSKRIDMVCLPVIITQPRIRVVDFSDPVLFSVFSVWTRADSTITDTAELNDPQHKMVYIDGTAPMAMTKRLFPKAGSVSLTEMSPTSDMFHSVITRKADGVYSDASNAGLFSRYNPGQIKPLHDADTDRVLPWAFMTPPNEYQFTKMITLVLQDMQMDGTIAKIVAKHNAKEMYLPAPPKYATTGF